MGIKLGPGGEVDGEQLEAVPNPFLCPRSLRGKLLRRGSQPARVRPNTAAPPPSCCAFEHTVEVQGALAMSSHHFKRASLRQLSWQILEAGRGDELPLHDSFESTRQHS